MTIDPDRLNRDVSLNRTVVGPVTGRDLLSRDAVMAMAEKVLGRPVGPTRVADALLAAGPDARPVVDEMGTRLAALIGAASRHWPPVEFVAIAGGLVPAAIAVRVAAVASEVSGFDVRPAPAHAALVGAARTCRQGTRRQLVLDGGHTSIKRAVATIVDDAVTALDVLSPVPLGP